MASTRSRLLRLLTGTRTETNGIVSFDTVKDLLVTNFNRDMINGDYEARDYTTGYDGAQGDELFNIQAGVKFDIEAGMAAAGGQDPVFSELLKAAGLARAAASSFIIYSPQNNATDIPEVAFDMSDSDRRQVLENARGSMSFSAENGKKPVFSFNFMGGYSDATAAVASEPDFDDWVSALECTAANMNSFSIGGVELCVQSISLSDGRTPTRGLYMNCDETNIRGRNVTGRVVVQMPPAGTIDLLGIATSKAKQALIWEIGKDGDPQFTLSGPAVQLKYAGEQDIGGNIGMAFDLIFTADQGDDEFSFTWRQQDGG